MKSINCFLVDDDEEDIEIFQYALDGVEEPTEYENALGGYEALERLRINDAVPPDYIFMDLNMPGMNGIECMMEIKKIPGFEHLPVIISSTSMFQLHEEKLIRLHAAHYLIKPTNIVAFSKILSDLFKKKNLPFLLNP